MIDLLIVIVLCYLIGSIPTAIIAARSARGIDIREHGSGNVGGTNAFRILGWKIGMTVMIFDFGKGWFAAYYIAQLGYNNGIIDPLLVQILAGSFSIIGHIYTLFAGFKGGKGVGTAAGMLLAVYPIALLFCFAVFAITVGTTKYVSLASMLGALTLPISLYIREQFFGGEIELVRYIFAILIVVLIVYTHRSNIQRLLNGEENKFSTHKAI